MARKNNIHRTLKKAEKMATKKQNRRGAVRRARRILKDADVHIVRNGIHRTRYGGGLGRRDVQNKDKE